MHACMRSFAALVLLFAAGCSAPEADGAATPNPTLLAISAMLTQTRAAPTVTLTRTVTPTRAITPSATVETPQPGSQKRPAPVDAPFTLGNARVSITAIRSLSELNNASAGEGQTFLDLDIAIENTGDTAVFYNRLDFRLLDAEQNEVFPAAAAAGPLLLGGTLAPGAFVRGHASFLVNGSTVDWMLAYRPQDEAGRTIGEAWFAIAENSRLPDGPAPAANWPPASLPVTGQRVEQDGIALTVESAQVTARLAQGKPPKGIRFLAVAARIENTGRVKTPYNALYFRAKDAAGYEYTPLIGAPEESLQPGSLAQGRSTRGTVFFALPEDISAVQITYQPSVLFVDYPQIQIAVPIPSGG